MGICTALLGLARIAGIVIFAFTNYFATAYTTVIWPVLGWLFFPITTLAYMWAKNVNGQVDGIWIVVMIVAVALDFALSNASVKELTE